MKAICEFCFVGLLLFVVLAAAVSGQVVVQPAPVVIQPAPVLVQPAPVVVQPQPAALYQPAMIYTPVWKSGPLGIFWHRSWQAQPVPLVPIQPQPQQSPPMRAPKQ